MPGIVRAPLHAFKYGRIIGSGIDICVFEALRHDFGSKTLHDIVEQNLFHNAFPSFPHFRVELDNARAKLLVCRVVCAMSECCQVLLDIVKALENSLQLLRLLGFIDQAEPFVPSATHPLGLISIA